MNEKRRVSKDFPYRFRRFMSVLSYGIELDERAHVNGEFRRLEINPGKFFADDGFYVEMPAAERELRAIIETGDRLAWLIGSPGSGKTTLLGRVLGTHNECPEGDVFYFDFMRDKAFEDSTVGPKEAVRWLEAQLIEKSWARYKAIVDPSMKNLVFNYLDYLNTARSERRKHFLPSTAIQEAIQEIEIAYELDSGFPSAPQERAKEMFAWLRQKLRGGDAEAKKLFGDFLRGATARDVLFMVAYQSDVPRLNLVFDNLDSIARPDTANAIGEWIRNNADPFRDSALMIAVVRTENQIFVGASDVGAVRMVTTDMDDRADQVEGEDSSTGEEDTAPGGSFSGRRRSFERSLIKKRLDYLRRWYEKSDGSFPDEVRGLFGAFWSARLVQRVREDADALANWNYRDLVASLGNFTKDLYLYLDIDWHEIDWDADRPLSDLERIHIESLYYGWIAGSLPDRSSPKMAVREYNPVRWHHQAARNQACETGIVRHDSTQQMRMLMPMRHHLLLAACYNAAGMDRDSEIRLADMSVVMRWMCELGFGPKQVADTLHDLTTARPRSVTRYVDASESEFLPEVETESVATEPRFGEHFWQEFGNSRRYLIHLVRRDRFFSYRDGAESAVLPAHAALTDRGRQIIEYVAVKFHFILGLLDHQFAVRAHDDRSWRDLRTSPVNKKSFDRSLKKIGLMAGHSIRALEEARPTFAHIDGAAWLDEYRNRFCLMNVDRAPYAEGGNLFIERLLLSTEKYLEWMNQLRLQDDPSASYLVDVRRISREFRELIDKRVGPGLDIPDGDRPEWLGRFDEMLG